MGFLAGKKALIVGVASNRSIAYAIAQCMHREGAELAFTYPNDKLQARVEKFAKEFDSDIVLPLDVTSDEQLEGVFTDLKKHWDGVDIIIHSVAFAPGEELKGSYVDSVTRGGYAMAQDISSYSFVALAKYGREMMQGRNASMLTLSYLGAVRSLDNYNVMGPAKASLEANVRFMAYDLGKEGIRVNGISAGPIKTLAAAGIGDFRKMLDQFAAAAPLKRNVTQEEVGNVAAFLCSDLASGVTGEITYVDCGYSTVGMTGLSE